MTASTALAFGASVFIELIQAFTPLGIAADITDVLLNTAGCLAASLPAALLHRFTLPRRPVAEAEISPGGSPLDAGGGPVGSVTVPVVEPPFGGDGIDRQFL
ncbi:VanZ family protein [Kribbella sp. NBC_01245]|uniref:VanZ family protein n=1 Tax=Kribbella sp. NBC_01245 TaxID=2903578 RepID=UPI003FA5AB19